MIKFKDSKKFQIAYTTQINIGRYSLQMHLSLGFKSLAHIIGYHFNKMKWSITKISQSVSCSYFHLINSMKFELILSKIKYLPLGYKMKLLQEGVKNKWCKKWSNERDARGEKWAKCLKKHDIKRIAFWDVCSIMINYKSNYKKAMQNPQKECKNS